MTATPSALLTLDEYLVLDGEDVLPGFVLPVAGIFAGLERG
jgi:hypothetical protein